jgi:multidrug efflux system membrane fusion protein
LFGAWIKGGGGVKGRLAALGAGVALIAGGLGVWLILDPTARVATAKSSGSVPAIPVTIGLVTAEDVPVFLHGISTVQAFNTVTVKSRVDGPIVGVDFTEGQEVTAGAVLFRIDPAPYQAALARTHAAKNKDKAQLESAQLDLDRFSTLVVKGVPWL